jgi:dolichyl-phosphate-mannose-protein mannosyltransferase
MPRQKTRDADSLREPVSRLELAFVAALVLAGIALRLAFPSRIAVEHFDEGVYASNVWFESGVYPFRHLYAPWVLPFLAEVSILVFGPSGFGPTAACLFAGCGTTFSVWWISRAWFGRQAAVFSLALASFSDIHAVFSRMALTDALLVFWLVWAIYFLARALSGGRSRLPGGTRSGRAAPTHWKACLACGVFTGLAWWTKYNGWLPLAIGLAAIGVLAVIPATRGETLRRLLSWLVVAAIAAALIVPVWISLLPTGGYAPVAANHAKYVVGLVGWPASVEQQLANLAHFDGWASILAPVVGLGLAVCLSAEKKPEARAARAGIAVIASIFLIAAGTVGGSLAVSLCLALAACTWTLARATWHDAGDAQLVPSTILLVWLLGLLVATPYYTPYARLTLPLVAASWIGSGLAIAILTARSEMIQHALRRRVFEIPFVAGAVIALGPIFWYGPRVVERGVPAWQDHAGLQAVAREAVEKLGPRPGGEQPVFLVYGEPALFFHLRARGAEAAAIGDLGFAEHGRSKIPPATYLVIGPHARRDSEFLAAWKRVSDRFEPAGEFEYRPSDAVLLDTHHPRELPSRDDRTEKIEVYRLRPLESRL